MLTNEQLEDLAQLHVIAEPFACEVVIIGAAALLCFVNLGRFTRDIDIVVALDLEDFVALSGNLKAGGWTQEPGTEHRLRTKGIVNLMPVPVQSYEPPNE